MIRVHVAHDHRLPRHVLRVALAAEFDVEVVNVSPEGAEGLREVGGTRADMLVLWVLWREQPLDEVVRYRRAALGMRIVGLFSQPGIRNELRAAGADAVVDEADGLTGLMRRLAGWPGSKTATRPSRARHRSFPNSDERTEAHRRGECWRRSEGRASST